MITTAVCRETLADNGTDQCLVPILLFYLVSSLSLQGGGASVLFPRNGTRFGGGNTSPLKTTALRATGVSKALNETNHEGFHDTTFPRLGQPVFLYGIPPPNSTVVEGMA